MKYRFSLGYLDQDGIIAPSGHKRLNVRANVDAEAVSYTHLDVYKRQVLGINEKSSASQLFRAKSVLAKRVKEWIMHNG